MITYQVAKYELGDKFVEMTFTDDNGLVYKRSVNIPYNSDRTVNEEYLQEIFEGQYRGIINKLKLNVITFTEPDENVGIVTTVS